jgi:SAM-dependent methyltransferase
MAVTTAAELSRPLARLSGCWDELADADALWAVLSGPDRKGGRWSLEEFVAAGEQEIDHHLERAHTLYGRPIRRSLALDFGCGAGRLVHPLARRFGRVVGVDVSPAMIEHARRTTSEFGNVELVVNTSPTLESFESGTFDFVYTNLVLQHVPSLSLIESYVGELVRITAPDGIAVLQAPHTIPAAHRLQPLRRFYGLLRLLGVPSRFLILRTPLQPMHMTAIPRGRFEAAVAAAGGTVLGVEPDGPFAFRYAIAGPATRNGIEGH